MFKILLYSIWNYFYNVRVMVVKKVNSVNNRVNFAKKDNEGKKSSPVVRYGLPTVGGLAGAATGAVAIGRRMTLKDILKNPKEALGELYRNKNGRIKSQSKELEALWTLDRVIKDQSEFPLIEKALCPKGAPDRQTIEELLVNYSKSNFDRDIITDWEGKTLTEVKDEITARLLKQASLDEALAIAEQKCRELEAGAEIIEPQLQAAKEASRKAFVEAEAEVIKHSNLAEEAVSVKSFIERMEMMADEGGRVPTHKLKELLKESFDTSIMEREMKEAFEVLKKGGVLPKRLSIIKGVMGAVIGVAVAIGAVKALAPEKTVDTQA